VTPLKIPTESPEHVTTVVTPSGDMDPLQPLALSDEEFAMLDAFIKSE
jgi:hypothetical protein